MKLNKINKMYVLTFIFTIHISLAAYVNSTFLATIIDEKYVGLVYTIASILTLISLSESANILKYFGNKKLILTLLIINMLGLFGLTTSNEPYKLAISFISFLSTNTLILLCLDIFIERFSDPEKIAKTRGVYLTVINLAWMLSPLLSSIIITQTGDYKYIYIISLVTVIIMAIILMFSVNTFKDKKYIKPPFIKTYKFLLKNKDISAIVLINFILQFFYALMVVYTPLYLTKHLGLDWAQIGIIFTIMLIPFVIFSLPIGYLIQKFKISKKKLLFIGFIIMSISTAIISLITTKDIAIWAIVLFITRTGASIIETTSEIYFFSQTKEEEAYLLGIFRDMMPMAYIIAPLFAVFIFRILPFEYLFLILGIIVLLGGFYYIPKLRKYDRISN